MGSDSFPQAADFGDILCIAASEVTHRRKTVCLCEQGFGEKSAETSARTGDENTCWNS